MGLQWPEKLTHAALKKAGPELRKAIVVALYLGQRRAEPVKLARPHQTDGGLALAQEKTGERLVIPIHSRVQREIVDPLPEGQFMLLVTETGRPWTASHLSHRVTRLVRDCGFTGYNVSIR